MPPPSSPATARAERRFRWAYLASVAVKLAALLAFVLVVGWLAGGY